MPDTAATADLLRRRLEPLAAAAGLDLEEVQIGQAGRRRQLRLLVDRDGGVTLDECADLAQRVSAELDAAEPFGDSPYVLEVSSPGVSRPLTLPRHWRRARGRLVTAALSEGGEVTGRVRSAGRESVELMGVDGTARTLPYAQVAKARVQVELNRPDETEPEA